jgi:UDP-N-acetylglucosamine--N-acetylmuramyl-(pentapeptide) pyrophosphoryl-undecaprenol N-acetylglucosamine transferase
VRKTKPSLHIVFAGGVTGGHLFPGLAVAERVLNSAPETDISFLGPGAEFERKQVARYGYDYVPIACPRAPHGVAQTARFGYRMLQGYRTALRYLRRSRASVVVGLGSFASVPTALAAARLRIPLVLLEQNAVIGRANRRLARLASALCLSFDTTFAEPRDRFLAARHVTFVTGTPIRTEFSTAKHRGTRLPRIVVLGGSGGARLLNQSVPEAMAKLGSLVEQWQILHQAGAVDQAATEATYRAVGVKALVQTFFDDPAAILAAADLAICRAGGSTLAELAATRVPSILVPLDRAMDNHQRVNARSFAAAGAATVVDDTTKSVILAKHLAIEIAQLMGNPARRGAMQTSLGHLARLDAAAHVSEIVRYLASGNKIAAAGPSLAFPASPGSIDASAA